MRYLLCLLATAGPAFSAFADDASELDRVVVTATRQPMALDDLTLPVIVIDRAAIERNPGADVADLLRLHAGIDIGRNGGPGQTTSVFVRGTESNHTLVLIDGVAMNPGTLGGAAVQHIPLDSIERIEIVKGPRSSLYGSDAVGGVINIITRRATDGVRTRGGVEAGSFATRALNAGVDAARDAWRGGVSLARRETDGFPTLRGSDIDRGYERSSTNLYGGYRNTTFDIELRHWRSEGTSEYLGFFGEPLSQDFENTVSSAEFEISPLDAWRMNFLLADAVDDLRQNDANFLGEFDFVSTDRNSLDWQNDLFINDDHVVALGVYAEDEDTRARSFGSGFDETVKTRALYAQDSLQAGYHSLLLAARVTDHDAFGKHTTGNVEYGYTVNDKLRLTAGIGNAFRAPDSTDRFGFGGNPDLEPEQSRNMEAGARWQFTESQRFEASLFQNTIDDLIAFVDPDGFAGPLPGANQNIDEARIRGLELRHAWNGGAWRWHTEIILQDPEDKTTGSQLARRAKRSLTSRLLRQWDAFEAGLDVLATGERPDSPFSTVVLPGYAVWNLTGRWRFAPGWSLAGRIENLADKDYETAAGFRSAERSFFLSLHYQGR